jgi:hypothetical protein
VELPCQPFPEFLDGRLARRDQQLAVTVAPQVEGQEIEPLGFSELFFA